MVNRRCKKAPWRGLVSGKAGVRVINRTGCGDVAWFDLIAIDWQAQNNDSETHG
jgi:hypothetical protein